MRRLPPIGNLEEVGACMLIYGPTGCGKTYSAITAPGKVLFVNREPKDARQIHMEHDPASVNRIDYVLSDGFDDDIKSYSELLAAYEAGKHPYDTIFDDGLTFNMVDYKQAIEDDRYNKNLLEIKDPKKQVLGLVDRFNVERKDWGTIADMMARKTFLLNQISQHGVLCVSTAIDTEYPKWNSSVRAAPALVGQEFPKLVHGYFGFIGYVIRPYHVKAGQIHPPQVSFISAGDGMSNSYMARCNSEKLTRAEIKYGPPSLNLGKIYQVIRGQVEV